MNLFRRISSIFVILGEYYENSAISANFVGMDVSAVITADIVNSTLLNSGSVQDLINQLRKTLQPFQHEFYRGDSFQVLVKKPAEALKLVIELRGEARK